MTTIEGRFRLRPLRVDDEAEAMAAHGELAAEGFTFLLDRDRAETFAAYLELLDRQRRGTDDHPQRVRSTFLVAELDGALVGRVSIRHELTERLRREGGHIGFGVRPGHRRRGVATRILEAALQLVAAEGVDEALVTCDHDNLASRAVIEGCGGRFVGQAVNDDGVEVHHFHVPTAQPARPGHRAGVAARRSGGRRPVALVTGANHGIGAATARALAADGVRVLVTGWPLVEERDPATPAAYDEERARDPEEVAAAIRHAGGDAVAVTQDLTLDDAATSLYDRAEAAFDAPVRILVHNASGWVGDTFGGSATDHIDRGLRPVTTASFDRQFAVDARAGALLIAEHARRHLARGDDWGRIVTLTSGGPDGFPGEASYGAAKAALDNYAMTAAAELGGVGVTVNAVMPPVTDTGWVTDPVREFVAGSWTHHHVATPDEVAGAIAWLCSDAAWLVTGNRIVLR